jgi:hypothetical protein
VGQLILFGGGDGGGIYIGPNGVRPIPPFEPALVRQFRAVSALAGAVQGLTDLEAQEQLAPLLNKTSNLLVGQVEGAIGEIDAEAGIVYLDPEGGFVCGSTGRPPIPIPWPVDSLPGLDELVAADLLEPTMLEAVDVALREGVEPVELFEDPAAVAERLGVSLSERSVATLKGIAPANVESIADPVDREVVSFFHRALESGEHAATWATRPVKVANALKFELSDDARRRIERIVAAERSGIFDPSGPKESPAIAIGVVVAVVIMLVPTEAGITRLAVSDRSGLEKF